MTRHDNGTCYAEGQFLGLWNNTVFRNVTHIKRLSASEEYYKWVLQKYSFIHMSVKVNYSYFIHTRLQSIQNNHNVRWISLSSFLDESDQQLHYFLKHMHMLFRSFKHHARKVIYMCSPIFAYVIHNHIQLF